MTNKVAIYARVSTAIQADHGVSINDQIACCVAYCKANNLSYDVFVDVISGSKEDRPQFNAMRENISKYSKVIVAKVDRLARKLSIAVNFIDFLDAANIEFVSVKDNISSKNYQNRFMLNMLSVASSYERDQIVERVKSTKSFLKRNNLVAGATPYGYDVDENGKLIHNANEMVVVAMIKRNSRMGYSYSAIASMLNEAGEKTKRGNKWFAQTIKNVILYHSQQPA